MCSLYESLSSATKNPILTEIHQNDWVDFYEALETSTVDRSCFENHWQYIIQATRNKGFVLRSNLSRLYYSIRKSPSKRDTLVVANQFGDESKNLAIHLANYAYSNKMNFLIKNINVSCLAEWEKLGFQESQEHWNKYSKKDDNSFPEGIYNLKNLSLAHMTVSRREQRTCNKTTAKTIRKFLRERDITINLYSPDEELQVKHLLDNCARFIEQKGVDTYQNVIDAHTFIFDYTLPYALSYSFYENNELIGFLYATHIKNHIFTNVLLCRNESDLMRFLLWKGLHTIYQTLNNPLLSVTLQGSENSGQAAWKNSFYPLRHIDKTHICKPYTSQQNSYYEGTQP